MIFEYVAKVSRVVDGDTLWMLVDLGFGIQANLEFRLYGVNTPEVIGATKALGLAAKGELERLLSLGTLRIITHKADKYGRWLAEVYVRPLNAVEISVNQSLLNAGFAKPYFGEGPKV